MTEVSIRMLNRRPCATCRTDTVHYSTKCQQCGALNLDGVGAVGEAKRRIRARYHAGAGIAGVENYNNMRRKLDLERALYLKKAGKRFKDVPLKRGHQNY
jgi:hypothetical protein